MIEVQNLVKRYGKKNALEGVSFSVKEGEILGFLGKNGAGKSTTMNIITGYLAATEGTVTIQGKEIYDDPKAVKEKIGYLPEIPPLYPDMTVKEYLSFMFDLKKVKLPKQEHIKSVCEKVRIKDVEDRLIKNLSKGYKQRVGVAQALLGNPPILILDEPTVGLDPNQIIEMRELIKELGKKHTVILSSHVLSEIQAVCDRIIIIHEGKIVADDTKDNLSNRLVSENEISLCIEGDKEKVKSDLEKISGVLEVKVGQKSEEKAFEYVVKSEPQIDVRRDIFKVCSSNGYIILGMKKEVLTLEDIFIKLTSDEYTGAQKEIETEEKVNESDN